MGSANFFFVLLAAAASSLAVQGSDYGDYPIANLSTLWTNNEASLPNGLSYMDGTTVRAIVLRSPRVGGDFGGWSFAAGFFCASPCEVFLFSVFIVGTDSGGWFYETGTGPQVVWSANRASPVRENATLELTGHGDLVLRDANGSMVWSSGTSDKSVARMEITKLGNLVLFDRRNATVWQSFDHPTDSLVPGQSLLEGMRLTANTSSRMADSASLYSLVNIATSRCH